MGVANARAIAELPRESTAAPSGETRECAVSDEQWDFFVASHPLGHHEQSSQYALRREAFGYKSIRIAIRRAGRVVGGAQMLVQRSPIGTLATLPCGPLAIDDDMAILLEVTDQLDRMARRLSWVSIRVNTLPPHTASRQALAMAGFEPSQSWSGSHASIVNSLNFSNEALVAQMDKKHRYHIRCAQRAGVEVRAGAADSVAEFAELHRLTAEHHQFPCYSLDYFEYLWKIFGPKSRVQHFVAYLGDVAVAGAFNTIVGSHMIYGWGGLRREPKYEKLMASYLVHVFAMQWAREHGCTHYDFSGNSVFKRKFAGSEVCWPAPYRKYYGRFAGLRRSLARATWSNRPLRRCTERLASAMGLRTRMPN